MGISIDEGGIGVDDGKFYLLNLEVEPVYSELLIYYLKVACLVFYHSNPNNYGGTR
jgi:hypothetical protein